MLIFLYFLSFFALDASNHDHRGSNPAPEAKIFTDQELINMIDPILQNDDKNGDGLVLQIKRMCKYGLNINIAF